MLFECSKGQDEPITFTGSFCCATTARVPQRGAAEGTMQNPRAVLSNIPVIRSFCITTERSKNTRGTRTPGNETNLFWGKTKRDGVPRVHAWGTGANG